MPLTRPWTVAEDAGLREVLGRLAADMNRPAAEVGVRLEALASAAEAAWVLAPRLPSILNHRD